MAHYSMPNSLLCLLITFNFIAPCISTAQTRPTSVFIFGDSSADVGTNNYIPDIDFKANHTPFGINYPGKVATGRWSDGYNTIDYLCQKMLKYKESPEPYLALQEQENPDYTHGVNFASAGAGLLDPTVETFKVKAISVQLEQFLNVVKKLATLKGEDYFNWISKAIFLISIGSNDIIAFGPSHENLSQKDQDQATIDYPTYLVRGSKALIEDLYSLGARRFGVISVLAMGCCPYLREKDTRDCSSRYNRMSVVYMLQLKRELKELQKKYTDIKYSFADTNSMMLNVLSRDSKRPLKFFSEACCKNGCQNDEAPVCENPEDYAFWDAFHPTDAASKFMAEALYEGTKQDVGQEYVTPITFKQLAEDGYENDYVNDLVKVDAMLMET